MNMYIYISIEDNNNNNKFHFAIKESIKIYFLPLINLPRTNSQNRLTHFLRSQTITIEYKD